MQNSVNHRIVERTLRPVSPLMGHVRLRAVFCYVRNGVSRAAVSAVRTAWQSLPGATLRPLERWDALRVTLLFKWTSYVNCLRFVGVASRYARFRVCCRREPARFCSAAVVLLLALCPCVFERFFYLRPQIERDPPAELKHINKRRKRNQQGFP